MDQTEGIYQAIATIFASLIAMLGVVIQLRHSSKQALAIEERRFAADEYARESDLSSARSKITCLALSEIKHNTNAAISAIAAIELLEDSINARFPVDLSVIDIIGSCGQRVDINSSWSINSNVKTLNGPQITALTAYWIAARVANLASARLAPLLQHNKPLALEVTSQLRKDFAELLERCDAAEKCLS